MSNILRDFTVGLLALIEEINRLLPVRVDLEHLVTITGRLEEAVDRLRWLMSAINEDDLGDVASNFRGQLENIKRSLEPLQLRLFEKKRSLESETYQCQRAGQGNVGRPRYIISRQQILYLREFSFKWTEIAGILGISISTLNRHRASLGLGSEPRFTAITDEDLDTLVREIVGRSPFSGIRIVQGEMEDKGVHVQTQRVRAALHRVDGLNVRTRLSHVVQRRRYRVPGPNSLWHVDGNHKLIRWKFVVHGGIDGFSRLCVYLGCATNNRAATVRDLFYVATSEFGWPSRVRSDHGMENVEVARAMINRRGTGRGSHITGNSVHNQRIERLWRDYFRCVGSLYYTLFYFMEDTGILTPDNDIDLFCLHVVYTPLINKALEIFKGSWNNHKLSSEGNATPQQLYIRGMLQRFGTDDPAIRDVIDGESIDENQFGIDWSGPTPENRSNNDVQVREVTFPLTDMQRGQLEARIRSLEPCPNHGISLYLAAKDFVNSVV